MKLRLPRIALIVCTALGLSVPPVRAAAPPVSRLAGSFIQYQTEMQGWAPETWRAVLDSMKELRMNTIIIQMLASENADGSTYSFMGYPGQPDATETILSYADTNGFKVILGLYLPNWNHDMLASNFLYETQVKMATVAQQAWATYLSGNRHHSFAGWYIPYEPWTANYQSADVNRLRSFFQAIHGACEGISGDMPLSVSPFISAQRPAPCQVEQLYRQILDQSGIDIVLLQDSVGAQEWNTDIVQRASPYFQAFKNACDATGVQLWANLESFQISGSVFTSCDPARFRKQFDAAAPFVQDFVTFDFVHYMNTAAFLSWWDQARRDRMRQLHDGYKADFVDIDYAPLAAPVVSPVLGDEKLTLRWAGMPDEPFEVQFKANLAAAWTSLNGRITNDGTAFSFADSTTNQTGFYRVVKLPKLQVADSMVWIPPGSFIMGTPAGDTNRTSAELPQFPVTFTHGFWIGRFEVTQSEYQNVVCTNPAAFATDLNNPVEKVSWSDAMEYCRRLTERERQAGRLPEGYVYRLPSEAEWEYAARAGSTNGFSFGDDWTLLRSYGWYLDNSGQHTHAGGQLQANAWGLSDVHGNVFEWCWDWIGTAPGGPVTNYVGSVTGAYHCIRGGAWSFGWVNCRCSWRTGYAPVARQSYLGFRVLLAPPG